MDASLPTDKEHRLLNAMSLNSLLSGSEGPSNRGGSGLKGQLQLQRVRCEDSIKSFRVSAGPRQRAIEQISVCGSGHRSRAQAAP